MNDIKKEYWNERIKQCMRDGNYKNQTKLAEAINEKYGTNFTQKRISQWMNLGEKNNALKGFPEFENMIILADFFNVSVSFLIGETDYKKIEHEKISEELGLSEPAIVSIKNMTTYDSNSSFLKQDKAKSFTNVLNNLFVTETFRELIDNLNELSHQFDSDEKVKKELMKLCNIVGKETFTEAMEIYQSKYSYDSYDLTEHIIETIQLIDSTINNLCIIDDKHTLYSDAFRFKVQHTIYQLIEELFPTNSTFYLEE